MDKGFADLDAQALHKASELASTFASTIIERDQQGGTPKAQRDALRASGLLSLSVPPSLGGQGADWATVLATVRTLAQADSSVAHVYAFHHLLLATARLFGSEAQWSPLLQDTVTHGWFWGNALNPLDRRTIAVPNGQDYEFSGEKSFCSGALDSDILLASALRKSDEKLLIAVIPTAREGIHLFEDWDCIGQRQTDSGSARFDGVQVAEHELLLTPGPLSSPYACLRPLLAQLILATIYLGIAEGALAEARAYTTGSARAWHASLADEAWQDPYILRNYGEFWLAIEGASALLNRAVERFDRAWLRGTALSAEERGAVAIATASAKVAASRAGLEVSSRIFEVMGARATAGKLRLDRFWRNVRTHTLHDPVDYKLAELGDWALNRHIPTPTFYS